MDYAELLFASKMRTRARQFAIFDAENANMEIDEFMAGKSYNEYILRALKEAQGIAALIRGSLEQHPG